MLDPNYLSVDFAASSRGYLSTPASALSTFLHKLPTPISMREYAIVEAIKHGIAYPTRWEQNRKPIKLSRTGPEAALALSKPYPI
jgi:hypothetical protein